MTLLSAENLRQGSVWNWFMANPEPQKAMQLAGIEKVKGDPDEQAGYCAVLAI